MKRDAPRINEETNVITMMAVRRLQEGRDEGKGDTAAQRHFISQHVGRDDCLSMAGAGGVKDAIGKGKTGQHPEFRAVPAHRLQRAGQRAVKSLLLDIDPVQPPCKQPGRGKRRFVRANAKRTRVGMTEKMRQDIGHGEETEYYAYYPLAQGMPLQVSSSLVAKILLDRCRPGR